MPVSRKRKKKKGSGKSHNSGTESRDYLSMGERNLLEKVKSSDLLKDLEIKKGRSGLKVSELIMDFGSDLIDDCRNELEYRQFIPFIIACWNIGNFDETEREEEIKKLVEILQVHELEKDFRSLVERKVKYFSKHRYHIVQYEITMIKGTDLHLSVVSAPI